ncbi:MAG: efflux transporter periplasmic adaptor subunit [Rickettsiales bacterium]|nr:MAG: efflux transporter periplasmic adaptor subunit [Rickettsiales bacterium]
MLASCSKEIEDSPPVLVKPAKIATHDFHEKFIAIGQFKYESSKTYYAKIAGTVDSIPTHQGERILKGDILITIDGEIAKTLKNQADASFISAQSSYERELSLYKKKIIKTEALDRSKVALETAKANRASAMKKYDNMVIKAPFDGYVGVVRARVGDYLKIGDYLFSFIENGDKTVFIELPEILHGQIDKTTEVFVTDTKGTKSSGRIVAVSDYLSNRGTITTKLLFPLSAAIVHGSYVETEIVFNKHSAMGVPEKAVLKNSTGNFIYKITSDNVIKQVYVGVGSRTDGIIEISSEEITEGDLIVIEGLTKVSDKSKIELIKEDSGTVSSKTTDSKAVDSKAVDSKAMGSSQ